VPWSLCAKTLSAFLCLLCVSAVSPYCIFAFRRLSPVHSLQRHPKSARGGLLPYDRCTCVISVESAEPTATQKCQFSGLSRASRLSFRRINLQFVHFSHFLHIHAAQLPFHLTFNFSLSTTNKTPHSMSGALLLTQYTKRSTSYRMPNCPSVPRSDSCVTGLVK
jgi:hypothetical protein